MRRLAQLALLAFVVAGLAGTESARPEQAAPSRPLLTGVADPSAIEADAALAMNRIRAAGATVVRIVLPWEGVAPVSPGPAFRASDPDDPAYAWGRFDDQVRAADANGLSVLAVVVGAPPWAQDRPARAPAQDASWRVRPPALAAFATAAARRYSGGTAPRVRFWQVWNEPNYSGFLNPQLASQLDRPPSLPLDADDVVSPDQYRELVNAFGDAVRAVDSSNLVVAGGLLPFSGAGPSIGVSVGPLLFMRKLLCMSGGATPRPTCGHEIRFDVWSTHPYTVGGPRVHATLPDDVSIGDLPEMNRLLRAAVAAGRVRSSRPVEFWVTEFGWDTKPPDSHGVPLGLHARWVAEALYRMWSAGVTLVAWFGLRDDETRGRPEGNVIQSGLYFRGDAPVGDRPKPTLAAFRFPFVAFHEGRRIRVWGRLPPQRSGAVVVEQSSSRGWRRLATLRPDANGIFGGLLGLRGSKPLIRARLAAGGLTSVPFSLRKPPDLVVNPFGGPVG
ncbi:MAG: cellulase family glycosylhydrolase [Gaiellaceae bacterium]